MKYSLSLGKIAGIKIAVHWTFLILIAWIVLANMRSGAGANEILWSVFFVLTIFFCVILHELGHALAARRYHIKTRNITILPIGGVAQLESIPEKPKEELVVAIAGPLVNLVIAIVLYPFVRMITTVEEFTSLQKIGPENFLLGLMFINIWLAIFNLIPAFPMDGGRILRALLGLYMDHTRATRIAASVGQFLAIVFVFLGFTGNPVLIFIGLFIFLGAQAEANYSQHKLLLKGFTVQDVTMHDVPTLEEHITIGEAVSRLLDGQNRNFVVVKAGKPVATLSRDEIIRGLGELGEAGSIREIHNTNLVTIPSTMPLEHAWNLIQREKKSLVLVIDDVDLVGVVDQENMAEFILVRTAQGKNHQQ